MRRTLSLMLLCCLVTTTLSCSKSGEDGYRNDRLDIISMTPELPINNNGDIEFPKEGGTVEIVFEINFNSAPIQGIAIGKKRNHYRQAWVDNGSVSFYESDEDIPEISRKLKAGRHTLVVKTLPIPASAVDAGEVDNYFSIGFWKEHYDKYGNFLEYSGGGFNFTQQISY